MTPERITADALFPPPGYAHAVRAGSVVHTAGAVPLDAEGRLVGEGDVAAQTRQVLANLELQLTAAGARPADVVKTVIYVATERREDLPAVWEVVRASPFDGAAGTLLGVSHLGYPGQLVEIEAVAVLD
jgi:enamine deaminase RidA (YjgF/YER057c/UK114 family)